MHTAAFAAARHRRRWSYEAIDLAPERFADGYRRAARARLRRASTSPSPTSAPRSSSPASAPTPSRAIGAANTLSFGAGRDPRRQHRRERADRRAPGRLRSGRRRGARARRRRLGPGRRLGARPRRRGGRRSPTGPRRRRSSSPRELGVHALEAIGRASRSTSRPSTCSSTPPRSALQARVRRRLPRAADLKALRLRADQLVAPLVVVDLVYGSEPTELAATCTSGGATLDRRARDPGSPGRGLVPDLGRAGTTGGDHAQSDPRRTDEHTRATATDTCARCPPVSGSEALEPAARAGRARPG